MTPLDLFFYCLALAGGLVVLGLALGLLWFARLVLEGALRDR